MIERIIEPKRPFLEARPQSGQFLTRPSAARLRAKGFLVD